MPTIQFDTPVVDATTDTARHVGVHEPQPTTALVPSHEPRNEPRDLALPKLQIVNKVGKLSDEFSKHVGEFILDEVPTGLSSLKVVVLGATRGFEESVDFDDQRIPTRFASLADAHAAGFRHIDEGPSAAQVIDVALLYLLIEGPEGHFDLEFDGIAASYNLAQLAVRKGGFKDTFIAYNTARAMGHLRKDALASYWTLEITKKAFNGNTWYSPKLRKSTDKVGADLKAIIREEFELLVQG
jgi:hypothetical protein